MGLVLLADVHAAFVAAGALAAGAAKDAAAASANAKAAEANLQLASILSHFADDPAFQAFPRAWPRAIQYPAPKAGDHGFFEDVHDHVCGVINGYAPGAPSATKRFALARMVCWAWSSPRGPIRSASASVTQVTGGEADDAGQSGTPSGRVVEQLPGGLAWSTTVDRDMFRASGAAAALSPYRVRRARACVA